MPQKNQPAQPKKPRAKKAHPQGGLRSKVYTNPDTLPEVEIPQAEIPQVPEASEPTRELAVVEFEQMTLEEVVGGLQEVLSWGKSVAKAESLFKATVRINEQGRALDRFLSRIVFEVKNQQLWTLLVEMHGLGNPDDPNAEARFWLSAGFGDMRRVNDLFNFERDLAPVLERVNIDPLTYMAETVPSGIQAAIRAARDFTKQRREIEKQNLDPDERDAEEADDAIREKLMAYPKLPGSEVAAMARSQRGEPEPTPIDVGILVITTDEDGRAHGTATFHFDLDEANAIWRDHRYYFRYHALTPTGAKIDPSKIPGLMETMQPEVPSDMTGYRARVVEQSRPLYNASDDDDFDLGDDDLSEEERKALTMHRTMPSNTKTAA